MQNTYYNIRVINADTEQEAIVKFGDGNFNESHGLSDKVFTRQGLVNALDKKQVHIREVQPEFINQFVTYSIAEMLNKKGFKEKCIAKWGILSEALHWDIEGTKNTAINFLAPTWQQVIDWLRCKYGIEVWVEYSGKTGKSKKRKYTAKLKYVQGYLTFQFDYNPITAREQAILEALELIK